MFFLDLGNRFRSAASWLYQAYLTVYGWVWPFSELSGPLYDLHLSLWYMADTFYQLDSWQRDIATLLSQVLSWGSIQSLIFSWLPELPSLISWFSDWRNYVFGVVGDWWSWTESNVHDWVDSRIQELRDIGADWDFFVNVTLPNLVSWTWLTYWWSSRLQEIQGLVDSGFAARESLWAGWNQWRDKVASLFEDPEAWLLARIESMIVRFW